MPRQTSFSDNSPLASPAYPHSSRPTFPGQDSSSCSRSTAGVLQRNRCRQMCPPPMSEPHHDLCERADDGPRASPQRHPDLWFMDGSVVLNAQDKLFRVHFSQLSRHSAFFRDLFSLPQPNPSAAQFPASEEKIGGSEFIGQSYDGCPLIVLHDAAEDLANLLAALYDGPNFGDNDPDDFRIVSGILRLSTKYLIDSLRDKAIAHLTTVWPSTLKGWDAREDIARVAEIELGINRSHRYPSPIAVINLAREVNVPQLLPSAFYDLSCYSFAQILESSADDESLFQQQTLSPTDMRQLALGKESSQQAITSLILALGNSHLLRRSGAASDMRSASHLRKTSGATAGRVCVSAAACRKDFSELVDLATQHYLFDRETGYLDPLYVAEELGQLKSAEFSECKACAKSLESWAAKERERLWKLVPLWFRLDMNEALDKEPVR